MKRYLLVAVLFAGSADSAFAQPQPMVSGLRTPESVAVAADGKIYVTEIGEFNKDGDGAVVVVENGKAVPFVSDFFDFSVYIDASEEVLERWYVDRFLALRLTAFRDPMSYFHRYSRLSDSEAVATAKSIWDRINLVNLRENILPTRQRADLILTKNEGHLIDEVALRRL